MSGINNPITTGNQFESLIRSGAESSRLTGTTSGSYRGEAVRIQSSVQSFLDAMEELTTLGSGKAEKDLGKRKIKDNGARVNEAHELVSDYLRKVPDLEKKQKIEDLATQMSKSNILTIAQLQTYLNGFSEEKSHQYLALKAVKEFLGSRPESKHLLALIEKAILTIEQEPDSWSRIETDIRVSSFANDYSKDKHFSSLHELRGFYRDAVHDYQSLGSAYDDVVQRFGGNDVANAVDFMLQALSSDLSIQGSNIDSVKLQHLMQDMQKLRKLNTVQELVNNIFQIFKSEQVKHALSSH